MPLGIDKFKEALSIVAQIGLKVESRYSDDEKITWIEMIGLIPELWNIKYIVVNAKEIYEQMLDMDEAEAQECIEHVDEQIPDDLGNTGVIIELGFVVLMDLQQLGVHVKDLIDAIKEGRINE